MTWKIFARYNEIGHAVQSAAAFAHNSKSDAVAKKVEAIEKLGRATQMEEELREMDRRNHYSQGLTQAIRGNKKT